LCWAWRGWRSTTATRKAPGDGKLKTSYLIYYTILLSSFFINYFLYMEYRCKSEQLYSPQKQHFAKGNRLSII
jgi:hypothetical protein